MLVMKTKINILGIACSAMMFLAGFQSALAQVGNTVNARVPDPSANENGLWLRWNLPDLSGKSSVHVFRQEQGKSDWIRITDTPFGKKSRPLSKARIDADNQLKAFSEIADAIERGEKMEPIAEIFVLIQTVIDPDFAMHLGMLYKDTTVVPGKTYRYEVKNIAKNGAETSLGTTGFIDAGKFEREPAPSGFKGEAGDESARFTWEPEERIIYANFYYSTSKGGKKVPLTESPVLQMKSPNELGQMVYPEWILTQDSLKNGTTYYVEVAAVDMFGVESERSPVVEVTPRDMKAPLPPTDLQLTCSGYRVKLVWEQEPENDLRGFNIYRNRVGGDSTVAKVNSKLLDPNIRNYEDAVPDLNIVYAYAVEAVDKQGNVSISQAKMVQVYDTLAPAVPRGLQAVADTGVVRLSWSANKEPDLAGYKIYRGLAGAKPDQFILLTPTAYTGTTYLDTLPKQARNTFAYRITAADTVFNESGKSAESQARMPDVVSPEPPFIKGIRTEGMTIVIEWMPNLEDDLGGYFLERATSDKDTATWTRISPGGLAANGITYSDRKIEPGQNYYYRLQAFDLSRNLSRHSNVYMGFAADVKMKEPPRGFELKWQARPAGVALTWSAAQSEDLAGCIVYRKEGNGDFLPISGLLTEQKYADSKARPGKTYYYQVRAFDRAGNDAKTPALSISIPQPESEN
jgi:uncharacterized protein